MAKTKKSKKDTSGTMTAMLLAGGIGALIGLFALGRSKDGMSGIAGAIDRALGLPSGAAADGGSSAADLSLDEPRHGPGDRAAMDFRPDPTAGIDARKRDAFAPATLPNPTNAEPVI